MRDVEIRNNKRQISIRLIILICLLFLLGILAGAIYGTKINDTSFTELADNFVLYMENPQTAEYDIFPNVIKESKYILGIWLCGFLNFGFLPILGILFFRGISYGFAEAIVIKKFGSKGFYYLGSFFLPQSVVMIPVYIFISYIAIQFVFSKKTSFYGKKALKTEKQRVYTEYGIAAIACVIVSILGVAFQSFVIGVIYG